MTAASGTVSLDDIRAAATRIDGVALRTPLLAVPIGVVAAGASERPVADPSVVGRVPRSGPGDGRIEHLWLKCENLQPIGAFKVRGAFNMLAQLTEDQRRAGVVTYSSGNHGLAVAYAAARLRAPAVVVVPETVAQVKVDGIRRLGAEVVQAGTTVLHRQAKAEEMAAARGLTIVPPFDHPAIVAGQATVALEILEQLPDVGTIFVPMGGGGLSSGVATAVKLSKPSVRVVGVEPSGAAKMTTSFAAGEPVMLPRTESIADGLLSVRPGDLTFALLRRHVDELMTVEEAEIVAAVRWLFAEAKLVAEPSGAVSVAAALRGGAHPGPRVAIISGGNVDASRFVGCLTGVV